MNQERFWDLGIFISLHTEVESAMLLNLGMPTMSTSLMRVCHGNDLAKGNFLWGAPGAKSTDETEPIGDPPDFGKLSQPIQAKPKPAKL